MTSQLQHYNNSGNHAALRAKSANFQGLVFIPKIEKLLWDLNGKKKHKSMFRWPQSGISMCTESSNLSGEQFFPSTAVKA